MNFGLRVKIGLQPPTPHHTKESFCRSHGVLTEHGFRSVFFPFLPFLSSNRLMTQAKTIKNNSQTNLAEARETDTTSANKTARCIGSVFGQSETPRPPLTPTGKNRTQKIGIPNTITRRSPDETKKTRCRGSTRHYEFTNDIHKDFRALEAWVVCVVASARFELRFVRT